MTQAFDINTTPLNRGTLLLEASAGTGKTWSLTSIAVRLLLEKKVEKVEEVLLVTFTRKATDELRQRLRDRLQETEQVLRGTYPEDKLAKDVFLQEVREKWAGEAHALRCISGARRDVDLARVRTIHGFCQEILSEGAFEAGLPLDGAQRIEGDELLETAWRDALREFVLGQPEFVAITLKHFKLNELRLGALRTAMREPDHSWRPQPRPFDEVLEEYLGRISSFDFGALVTFRDSAPPKAWVKKGREECLPAIGLLAGGPDLGQGGHVQAVLAMNRKFIHDGLGTKGRPHLEGSPLEEQLEALASDTSDFEVGLRQSLLRLAIERYRELKEDLALIDHDDVIARTRARLWAEGSGERLARRIGNQFGAALVDEFQDTDGEQWDVFRKIFTPAPGERPQHVLVLVGDPKQAIYRFRGADIYAYLKARNAAPNRATLTRNWRATPGLVDAVNSIFGHRPDQSFGLEQIDFEPAEAAREADSGNVSPMQIVWVDQPHNTSQPNAESAVLQRLADDVVARRAEVPVGEGRQLAVLVQQHRQARAVVRVLRDRNVNAVLARGGDIHDSEAMREWRAILRALLDPADLRLQRRARATRVWGTRLSGLGTESSGFEDIELLARLRRTWEEEGVATMGSLLLGRRDSIRRCLAEEDGERMVTDLRHGIELLNREEAERGLGPAALLRWAEAEARSDDRQSEERPLRLDRQSDAVQILTNFTSKGLEFDTVFLPFAWYRSGPNSKPPLRAHDGEHEPVFDFSPDSPWKDQAMLEDFASDLRMHYVELTRAKERCVVYLAPIANSFPNTAAAFLLARADGDAGADRARWVSSERALLKSSVGEARETIGKRLKDATSISLREDLAGDERAASTRAGGEETFILAPVLSVFPDARRRALVPWRQLSYTALVHSLHERLDMDPVDLPLTDRADPSDAPVPVRGGGIFGFARGARAGICLHELLEKSEFERAVDEEDRRRVEKLLARHGLEVATAHPGEIDPVEVSIELIEQVRGERLPFGDVNFGALRMDDRLDEWQFNLPVVDLVPAQIGRLVREHWTGEEWVSHAAERLSRLPATRLQGMLGGFVDLLFTDGGRWTVLDWKSNDLGSSTADYSQSAMQRAMIEHDYVVQLLFYLVAAHRFLGTRIEDYEYDRHVAGASYVFLRGLCGDPRYGWCNVTPPSTLIEALDELFAGGRR
jgi:exodeoxyribonuclease V beta subunit